MAHEAKYVDLSDLREPAAWERVLDEVRATGAPAVIRADDEDIAELRPAKKRRTRIPRGKVITAEDSLWTIVGIGHSEGPTDVSENVDKCLAEAYADSHE